MTVASERLEIRGNLATTYSDVLTADAIAAITALAPLDDDRKAVMAARLERRAARARNKERITFLDPGSHIASERRSRSRRRGTVPSSEARFRPISAGSGSRARVRPRSPTLGRTQHPQHRSRAAFGR